MLVVTNISRFPCDWVSASGLRGEVRIAKTAADFVKCRSHPDCLMLVNCDPELTIQLARRLWLLRSHLPLASVDLVLWRPAAKLALIHTALKRRLLRRVDHHNHFFRDLSGLVEVYVIGPERSSFVEFKSNLQGERVDLFDEASMCSAPVAPCDDFDTFFAAMDMLPHSGAIAAPDFPSLREQESRFTRKVGDLPEMSACFPRTIAVR